MALKLDKARTVRIKGTVDRDGKAARRGGLQSLALA